MPPFCYSHPLTMRAKKEPRNQVKWSKSGAAVVRIAFSVLHTHANARRGTAHRPARCVPGLVSMRADLDRTYAQRAAPVSSPWRSTNSRGARGRGVEKGPKTEPYCCDLGGITHTPPGLSRPTPLP